MRRCIVFTLLVLLAAHASAQCPGVCQPTSYSCSSYYEAGYCPGDSSIQCCVEPTPDCSGQCQQTSLSCDGSYQAGLCPGPSDVECCTSGGGGGGGGSCPGVCQPTSYSCSSYYEAGYCPGDSSIQCCVESTPDCSGQCQQTSLPCGGSYQAGLCPGPSDVECCTFGGGGGGGGGGPGGYGVDVSSYIPTSTWSCLLSSGYTFAIVRSFMSTGSPDNNSPGTVANAHAAGISSVGVYMFPCPTCSASPQSQVQSAVSFLQNNGVNYDRFWLDIEGPQYWTSDVGTNVAFFNGLISQLQAMGQTIGVYTSASQWDPIMGGSTSGSSFPLWYAHYDDDPSFSDFSPFGGWSTPSIKQYYGDASVCGADVDLNWSP